MRKTTTLIAGIAISVFAATAPAFACGGLYQSNDVGCNQSGPFAQGQFHQYQPSHIYGQNNDQQFTIYNRDNPTPHVCNRSGNTIYCN